MAGNPLEATALLTLSAFARGAQPGACTRTGRLRRPPVKRIPLGAFGWAPLVAKGN
jgi:hypothetical protein